MLVIADQVRLPAADMLAAVVRQTFQIRRTEYPPELGEPPPDWARPWRGFITDYPLAWRELPDAFDALQRWNPILSGAAIDRTWRPDRWGWT